jgi:hypothetical protein
MISLPQSSDLCFYPSIDMQQCHNGSSFAFSLMNIIHCAISGDNDALFIVRILPALLNTHSDGADVAGITRY